MGAHPKVWGMWAGFIYIFDCACTDQLTVLGSGHQRNDWMQVGTSRIWLPSCAPCPLHVSHPLCTHPGPFRRATGPFGCTPLHTDTGTRPLSWFIPRSSMSLRRPDPFMISDASDRPLTPPGHRSTSHSLSQTLVCFYYPSLLGTLNSP